MDEIKILLCCGAGISSGFLASNARKAAKKAGMKVSVEAHSHSDVAGFMGSIDILMLGPHYKMELGNFQKLAEPYGVPVVVIPEDIYATIDGARLLDVAKKALAEAGK